jgi:hypothetical protein
MIAGNIIKYRKRVTLPEVPKNAEVVTIDDNLVMGFCDNCGKMLLGNDEFIRLSKGVICCHLCDRGNRMISIDVSLREIIEGLLELSSTDIIELIRSLEEKIDDPRFTTALKKYVVGNEPDANWIYIGDIIIPVNRDIVTINTVSSMTYVTYYKDEIFYTLDTVKIIPIPINDVSHWTNKIFNKSKLLKKFYDIDGNLNLAIIEQIIEQYIDDDKW